MPFWSEQRWRSEATQKGLVDPFDPEALEEAKYLLSIGDEIYVSSPSSQQVITKLTETNDSFSIEPGQFAFIITSERVILPPDVLGFISMRTGVKFGGLVNISGFNVDPGYQGRLIFAAFNAGPTRITFRKGQKIFSMWLADVPERVGKIKKGYERIPPELLNQISAEFTSLYRIKKDVEVLATDVNSLKSELATLKSNRIYLWVVLLLLAAILGPPIGERILDWFYPAKPAVSAPP